MKLWAACAYNTDTTIRPNDFQHYRPIVKIIITSQAVLPWCTVVVDRRFGPTIGGHLHCLFIFNKVFGQLSANSPQY